MTRKIHILLSFTVILLSSKALAQEEQLELEQTYQNYPTEIPEKLSPKLDGDFKLPTPLRNAAFSKICNGIADINIAFQYPLFGKVMLGAGFKWEYFQFADFITNNSFSNSGKLYNYAPFLQLTYLKFSTPRLFWDFSVKGGYAMMFFNSYTCANAGEPQPTQSSFYLVPQIGINLFVDESLSFSFLVSDIITFNNFNPSLMCLSSFAGLSTGDSNGKYHVLGIGFGFNYFFNKKLRK